MTATKKGKDNFDRVITGQTFKIYDDEENRYIKSIVLEKSEKQIKVQYIDQESNWNGLTFSDSREDFNDYRIRT